jgi:hypothetical protein
VDDDLTIMGFGLTAEGGSGSSVLLDAVVKYVEPTECSDLLIEYDVPSAIMLCAMEDATDA